MLNYIIVNTSITMKPRMRRGESNWNIFKIYLIDSLILFSFLLLSLLSN